MRENLPSYSEEGWNNEEQARRYRESGNEDKGLRNEIVVRNRGLVAKIAKKYENRTKLLEFHDLFQIGTLGFMHSLDKFEYDKGFKVITYGAWWIKQYIQREIWKYDRFLRLPVRKENHLINLARIRDEHIKIHGTEPTDKEFAEITGNDPKEMREMLQLDKGPLSLDYPLKEEGGSTFGSLLADERYLPSTQDVENKILLEMVFEGISPMERELLKYRNGFYGGRKNTLKKAGELVGRSLEGARQWEIKALKKAREILEK